ncbi:MAG: HAMP domain-containing sensor histidine kinase [Gemmatimonadaceae bacterium]
MHTGPAGRADAYTPEESLVPGTFERLLQHVPAAFAVTRGEQHTLVFANAEFRTLVAPFTDPLLLDRPIAAAFARRDATGLTVILDRAFRTGVVARSRRVDPADESAFPLLCSVWPELADGEPQHLVIELRTATHAEVTLEIQREVAERLLLSALRERDSADAAEAAKRSANFLAQESRRLAESLDEKETLAAMGRMALPYVGDWCIVDTLDEDGAMHRLVMHPDPAKHHILESLHGLWVPQADDEFGLPAAMRLRQPLVIADAVDEVLSTAARNPVVDKSLREIGIGPLLTVPLVIRDRLIGALTFVSGRDDRPFTTADIKLAEDLANRSATALDRARAFGEAIALKDKAETASLAKSTFLGMMSHELRTPLNAIGGYVDLIDMELHGPVTAAQHKDLGRIRTNQRYLTGLITDLLNLTRVGSGHLTYSIGDIGAAEMLAAGVALVEPLISQRELFYDGIECEDDVVARGDREKVIQILVNLLSNAIKFTVPGGRIRISCNATGQVVLINVRDTGIGIPEEKLGAIFEPFVQVKGGSLSPESGVGLGLSISRSLARNMDGDLTVVSTLGQGSCFTLSLPRSAAEPQSAE